MAELRRFRERLERFTTELLADYDGVLSRAMSGVAGRVTPPAEPAPGPPPPPTPEQTLYEGRVEIGVGPFYDIASLGAFERIVAEMTGVGEVAVRRFEASHAVVDVQLARPIALLGELHRALDAEFSSRQMGPARVQITFVEG